MAEINSVLAAHGVNVEAQLLGTRGELGYALTDIGIDYPDEVVERLREMSSDRPAAGPVLTLEAALRAAVGPEHVLLDADLRASYETDWTGRFTGQSRAVVRPASTAAGRARPDRVRRGRGPSRGAGGQDRPGGRQRPGARARPRPPVVLLTTRLTELGEVSPISRQVTAGAGVTLAALTAHARAAGLDFGVDLAARDSATVGGMVATNAGGIRVLRYGSMRDQVAGVEAVLVDGRIISRLDGLAKDSTGYDIGHLLAGSEGTLAVITRLRLRLVPAEPERAVALIAVGDTADAVDLLAALRSRLPGLSAAELCFAPGLALVARHLGVRAPLAGAGEAYVLVEVAAAVRSAGRPARCAGDVPAGARRYRRLVRGRPGPVVGAARTAYRSDQLGRRTREAGRVGATRPAGRASRAAADA